MGEIACATWVSNQSALRFGRQCPNHSVIRFSRYSWNTHHQLSSLSFVLPDKNNSIYGLSVQDLFIFSCVMQSRPRGTKQMLKQITGGKEIFYFLVWRGRNFSHHKKGGFSVLGPFCNISEKSFWWGPSWSILNNSFFLAKQEIGNTANVNIVKMWHSNTFIQIRQ